MSCMILDPFSAADQSILFSVPACENEASMRFPSSFYEPSKGRGHSIHGCRPRYRISGSIYPSVTMVSEDYFFRQCSRYPSDDVVDGGQQKLNFVDEIDCRLCVRILNAVFDAGQ